MLILDPLYETPIKTQARYPKVSTRMIKAVFWDFGGVLTTSPFEAFNRFEAERAIPTDFIRRVNATNPHDNAWAPLRVQPYRHG